MEVSDVQTTRLVVPHVCWRHEENYLRDTRRDAPSTFVKPLQRKHTLTDPIPDDLVLLVSDKHYQAGILVLV